MSFKKVIFILLFCASNLAYANEVLTIKSDYKKSLLSIGASTVVFSGSLYSGSAFGPNIDWRQNFLNSKFSLIYFVNPLIKSDNGIFAIALGTGLSYLFLGSDTVEQKLILNDSTVFAHSQKQSELRIYGEGYYNALPVFGSSSTGTYTGMGAGVKASWFKYLPVSGAIRYSSLMKGTDSATTISIVATYDWGF